ncbi:hypothetical protein X797_009937 [Metarhizium robertsii]|uniref:Uncharacterized protein n=1 Tax=Metarhizium robertsii TaxID=568076 RepID=A0A0A1UPP8_9HYPO|nr:hypothetical protein X797_009937 [Metarhizium robertsii]
MAISTETTLAIVALLLAVPQALVILWGWRRCRLGRRRRRTSDMSDEGPLIPLSHVPSTPRALEADAGRSMSWTSPQSTQAPLSISPHPTTTVMAPVSAAYHNAPFTVAPQQDHPAAGRLVSLSTYQFISIPASTLIATFAAKNR